jgi:hypothetical protein
MFNAPREGKFSQQALSTTDKLWSFFDEQHALNEQKLTEVFIDFWGQGLKDPGIRVKIQNIYREWRESIQAVIQEGAAKGELDPQASQYFPHLICAIIEGASLQYLIDADAMDLEEYFAFSFNLVDGVLSGAARSRESYPSDLTDAQWEKLQPLLPGQSAVGRPRSVNYREIVNAILYVNSSGIPWRMLPHDFPHWKTVYGYYNQWNKEGTLGHISGLLGVELYPAS